MLGDERIGVGRGGKREGEERERVSGKGNYIISYQQYLLCTPKICKLDICDDA